MREVPVNENAQRWPADDAADVEHGGEEAALDLGVAEVLDEVERQPHVHAVPHELEAEHGGRRCGHTRDGPQGSEPPPVVRGLLGRRSCWTDSGRGGLQVTRDVDLQLLGHPDGREGEGGTDEAGAPGREKDEPRGGEDGEF